MIALSRGPEGLYRLTAEMWLPRRLDEVFAFFADARNLEAITPPWLQFRILTSGQIELRPGALIDYRLKIRGIPVGWQTVIMAWEPPHRFVDRQRKGPYRVWLHEHTFEERDGGTLARDVVDYDMPLARLLHPLMIKRDITRIFEYRQEKIQSLFSAVGKSTP